MGKYDEAKQCFLSLLNTRKTSHDARFGLALTAEHGEQRGLTAAVESDHAHTVAVAECERKIGEQRAIRPGCPEALRIDQDHNGSGYGVAFRRRDVGERCGLRI